MSNRGGKNTGGRGRTGDGRRGITPRVMCVEPDAAGRDRIRLLLEGLPVALVMVDTVEAARRSLASDACDVVMVDVSVRGAFDLARERASGGDPGSTIFLATRPTVALTVRAMRCGAMDVLRKPLDPDELLARLDAAVQRSAQMRREDRRVERLERMCRRLAAEHEAPAADTAPAPRETAKPHRRTVERFTPEGEYAAQVQGELDVENLLRVTLEWMLAQTGPTNAAVYLPTGHDDYSLGAYVNYDLPKEASDFLLDHLADVVPARFEHQDAVHHLTTSAALERQLGEAAHLVTDPNAVIFPCIHRGECLAVVALFRGVRSPYTEASLERLRSMRPVFAAQLARVIRIHNRHKDEQWLGFDVDTGDASTGTDPFNGDPDTGDDRTDNRAA
jgi:FixJ family two-component response regulator